MNQWTQLKSGLILSLGEQRTRARKGWRKQSPTVVNPTKAWGDIHSVSVRPWTGGEIR